MDARPTEVKSRTIESLVWWMCSSDVVTEVGGQKNALKLNLKAFEWVLSQEKKLRYRLRNRYIDCVQEDPRASGIVNRKEVAQDQSKNS